MSVAECTGELGSRRIPYESLGATPGVLIPVRLAGPLSGVTFRTLLPEKERASSPYEIFDCRLLLAIDDFSRLLVGRNIVEVMYFSAYRPPPPGWKGGVRHEGGLAIDIGYFRNADGAGLNVERDFLAEAAPAKPCASARPPKLATAESIALRGISCAAIDGKIFDVVLTPDYDLEHENHFHLEVTP